MSDRTVWIGYDPRETAAFAVARSSIRKHQTGLLGIRALLLPELRAAGLYTRPTSERNGRMWDDISGAPMSTEFGVSRFLVPALQKTGYGLFMDCDMLVRTNLIRLFDACEREHKAVWVVKHDFTPLNEAKMDGQVQTRYFRKLWSSFCVFNCNHPANKKLTVELVNSVPGRDLHAFCWLKDDEIGEIDPAWNWIPDHSPADVDPKVVHFSEGGPWFRGYENVPFADEWRREFTRWAA